MTTPLKRTAAAAAVRFVKVRESHLPRPIQPLKPARCKNSPVWSNIVHSSNHPPDRALLNFHKKSWISTSRHLRLHSSSSDQERLLDDPTLAAADPKRNATGKISCALFDQKGSLTAGHKGLTKTEIAEQFDLRYRDLRDIDLRSEAITRILVRPKTILLQFFDLCMIIQADEALLVNPTRGVPGTSVSALDHDFEKRLSRGDEAADVPPLPYELRAVEGALVAVLSILREELLAAREVAAESAERLNLESGLAAAELDRVFEHSRRLAKIESKARSVRETIRELLDTDEDLAAMYLSDRLAGRPHDVADHQEAEYMLEAYHKAADALAESAAGAIDVIRRKENTFRSSLAVQRNQIMFLEARIAIHTLGLAAGTLVAGLFGMNLVNYMEETPWGFPAITAACLLLSTVFSVYGARKLRRIQALKGLRTHARSRRGR